MPTDEKLMRIYLEDHLAGATAGAARAQRLAEAEADSDDAAELAAFAHDVDQDRATLVAVMKAVGVGPNVLKTGLASLGEKVGAFKPNGFVVQRSPLTTVVELEAMQMAVRGKRSLWESVEHALTDSVPPDIDIPILIDRADQQLATLARLHDRRAATVFAPKPH
jgi:hypothetical protein